MGLNSLLFILALTCSDTVIKNTSKYPWNDYDTQILTYLKRRCGEVYPDAPCLKWMKKWGEKDYSAICTGQKVNSCTKDQKDFEIEYNHGALIIYTNYDQISSCK